MKKRLIINADDFGMSKAVNYGIIQAYKDGIVTSTSIMSNMESFEHGVDMLKNNMNLGVGIHLNITLGYPLTQAKSLINEKGVFTKKNFCKPNVEEVKIEFIAQIEKALKSGIRIDHIDGHHHIHQIDSLKDLVKELSDIYDLPIRGDMKASHGENEACLLTEFFENGATIKKFNDIIKNLKEDITYDLMCHPAYLDTDIIRYSSYIKHRLKEYDILTSEQAKQILIDNDVELITYRLLR